MSKRIKRAGSTKYFILDNGKVIKELPTLDEAKAFIRGAKDNVPPKKKEKEVKATEDGITVNDILKDAADGRVKKKHANAAKKLAK